MPFRPRIVLLVLTLLAFGDAVRGSFHFDDYSIFTGTTPWTTRPLTWLTFFLNEKIAGRDPFSWHALDLFLHAGCVLLLFACARRATSEWIAFLSAGLFAIHPIQTEAVAYVFARATLLMTLFCLCSWHCWLKERHWRGVALFALALLAKEECVAFPLFLLLGDRSVRRSKPIAAMLVLGAISGTNALLQTRAIAGAGAGFQAGVSPVAYAVAQGLIIWRYLSEIVVPIGFSVDPDLHPSLPGGIAGWSGLLALLWCFRKRPETLWFGGGLALLLASSSIFPAQDLAADRRMYLPMISLSIGIALLLAKLFAKLPRWAPAVTALGLIAVSVARSEVWRTEERLWRDALEKAPAKIRPRIQLARALPAEEALQVLEHARTIHPENPDVYAEIGRVYLQSGHPELAISAFGRVAALQPRNAQAWSNLGVAFTMMHQNNAATAQFEHALTLDPCLADARMNLHLEPCHASR